MSEGGIVSLRFSLLEWVIVVIELEILDLVFVDNFFKSVLLLIH